jgi:tRNA-dihydrouridine synthase 1
VLQLSGNDPVMLAEACALAERSGSIDAIDLNLGCPQQHASDNFYGSFLHDPVHWPLVWTRSSDIKSHFTIGIPDPLHKLADTLYVILYYESYFTNIKLCTIYYIDHSLELVP